MPTYVIKPEWDTPPHGDFASYVERLTAPKPAISVSPLQPQSQSQSSSATSAARAEAIAPALRPLGLKGSAVPVDLGRSLTPFLRGLRVARVVLLLLTVVQGAALMLWGWGSLIGPLMTAGLWWGLGGLSTVAATVLKAPEPLGGTGLQTNQERLRQLGLQRQSGKKTQ